MKFNAGIIDIRIAFIIGIRNAGIANLHILQTQNFFQFCIQFFANALSMQETDIFALSHDNDFQIPPHLALHIQK